MEKFGQDIGDIGIVEAVKIWRSSKDEGETEVSLSLMDDHDHKGDKGPKEYPLFMPKVDKDCMKECGCQEEDKDCKLFCRFNCLTDGQLSEVTTRYEFLMVYRMHCIPIILILGKPS
eukprot:sb/3476517/